MEPTPLHHDVASTPDDGTAYWTKTVDGVRLRFAHWYGDGPYVAIYPGRGEYIEKYGRVINELRARNLGCVVWDWRNQGLSDRKSKTGHVENYTEYQWDVDAILSAARKLIGPQNFHLVAHSMGGLVALRSLQTWVKFTSAVFTGPMWGMGMPAPLRGAYRLLSGAACLIGSGKGRVLGTQRSSYIGGADPNDNTLMADAETAKWVQSQLRAYPELALGGPSWAWLRASHAEISALKHFNLPDLPTLTLMGDLESVVDPAAIKGRVTSSANGKLVVCAGAKHEVLMEAGDVKRQVWREMDALWAKANA